MQGTQEISTLVIGSLYFVMQRRTHTWWGGEGQVIKDSRNGTYRIGNYLYFGERNNIRWNERYLELEKINDKYINLFISIFHNIILNIL